MGLQFKRSFELGVYAPRHDRCPTRPQVRRSRCHLGRDQGAHPRCRRGAVHGARLRGDQPEKPHLGREREPRGGALPLRLEGRAFPGGPHAPARSHEPGAHRAPRAHRARGGRTAAFVREDPLRDADPGPQARARREARREELPAPRGPRVRGSRALHPPLPLGAVRGDDRPLQGGVPRGASAPVAPGAHLEAAFRHGRALVYPCGHRRPQALR